MKLEYASKEAIKYACKHFHYSRSIPANPVGYSVFNGKNEWCRVVIFAVGATPHIASPYNLRQGEVIELVRVALNGKQGSTSQCVSVALRLIRRDIPLARLVVSYADIDQEHVGTIYQASNWYYEGKKGEDTKSGYIINGKKTHNKSVHSLGLRQTLAEVRKHLDPNATEFITKGKYKYIYPLKPEMIDLCKKLHKPYPKKPTAHI